MKPETKAERQFPLLVAIAAALFAAVLSVGWHQGNQQKQAAMRSLEYYRTEMQRWKDYSQRILAEREADLVRVCGGSQ